MEEGAIHYQICVQNALSALSLSLSLSASGDYNESWIATAAFIAKVVSYVNEMRFGFAFGSGFGPFLFHFGSSFSFFFALSSMSFTLRKNVWRSNPNGGGGKALVQK